MIIDAGPVLIADSLESLESEAWKTVISSKLASHEANKTFEFDLVKMPKPLISMRLILQKNLNKTEEVEHYKVRLVAHGFRQRLGIHFNKISASLISIATVCLTFTVLGSHMIMKDLVIMTTFLKSKVNEEIYMTLPKGIVLLDGCLRVDSGS